MQQFNRGHIIKASRFSWTGLNGYAEANDLPDLKMQQVYQDSTDCGFSVFSEGTGKLRTFVECSRVRDHEHELQATVFASICESTGRIDRPAVRMTITLFND